MATPEEIRRAREQSSIFGGLFDYVRANDARLAAEGRRPVLGGLLSKEPVMGTDTIRYEGLGPMLAGLLEPLARGVDAPRAAAQGLIPQEDMIGEAFGTAGTAMLGGGAVAKPAGSLGMNVLRDTPNEMRSNQVLVRIPVKDVEHGESAMPGGKLTWPDAPKLIEEYAQQDTNLPPIEIMADEGGMAMIADGSHRFEAAKLRGQDYVEAYVNADDLAELPSAQVVNSEPLEGFEGYLSRVNPSGKRIAAEDRPNLMMGDMYGMLPRGSDAVGESGDVTFFRSPDGDYYATAYNPDVGEQDVVGYITNRGDSTELQVVAEMQGQGIGGELQYLFRSENPDAPTGGLTEAGERALERTYDRLFDEGLVSANASKPTGLLVLEQQARGRPELKNLFDANNIDISDLSKADPGEIKGVLDMAVRRQMINPRQAESYLKGLLE